tara:strand:+ start:297 stop:710 length:414 start_codon:yes stop_codon:yes gene_type:complete
MKTVVNSLNIIQIFFFLILFYILLVDINIDYEYIPYIHNIFSYIGFFLITILLFLYSNPFLAIFYSVVISLFLFRTSKLILNDKPKEEVKYNYMKKLNKNSNKKINRDFNLENTIISNITNVDNTPNKSNIYVKNCS